MKRREINIAAVDDDPVFRNTFAGSIRGKPGYNLVLLVPGGHELLMRLHSCRPDVVLIDMHMPGLSGQETAKLMLEQGFEGKMLGMSNCFFSHLRDELKQLGAHGFCRKRFDVILAGIDLVYSQGNFFDDEAWDLKNEERPDNSFYWNPELLHLKENELMIVKAVATGKTSKEISETLNVSSRTIEGIRARILKKLNLSNEIQLTSWAWVNGLMDEVYFP